MSQNLDPKTLLQRFGLLEQFDSAKVLTIDDSKIFLSAVKSILSQVGCNVEGCQDSTEAIGVTLEIKPDIIIVDYEMPKIDGPQLCKILKSHEKTKNIPIILLTSREDAESMLTALDAGADDFITKNSLAEVLLAKTSSMLRLKRINNEMVRFKQFEAIQNMIATYNHEFNNALTILNGYIRMIEKSEESKNKDKIEKLKQTSDRIKGIVEKISELKNYEEEDYGQTSKMVKIT
jgi:PleD family two-component response regulator